MLRVRPRRRRPVVNTKYGKIRGIADGSVKIFKGVPYGAPTSGANRFMPPKPPMPWSDVRDATIARQSRAADRRDRIHGRRSGGAGSHRQSEDCLRLNIWTAGSWRRRRSVR